jgi:hypothetical protein
MIARMTRPLRRYQPGAAVKKCFRYGVAALSRRPALAYVGGWLGKQNLGDEVLLDACQHLFPAFQILAFDGGRLAVGLTRVSPIYRAGLLGGGTLIGMDRIFVESAEAFLSVRNDLIVFGTGVDTTRFLGKNGSARDWLPLLKRCKIAGVRGPDSAAALAEAGMPGVQVIGDPALAFARKDINPSFVPKSIGLNIGASDGSYWADADRVQREITQLAVQAKKAGWRVEWLVVMPRDLPNIQKAAEASGTTERIHLIYDDHIQFMEATRSLSVFVGMKLHATVLATCALTPSVMLEYRPKCLDYMKSIGQEAATVRTDEFSADQVWEMARHWDARRNEMATALARGIHSLQEKQRALAEKIARELMNRDEARAT